MSEATQPHIQAPGTAVRAQTASDRPPDQLAQERSSSEVHCLLRHAVENKQLAPLAGFLTETLD